MHVTLSQLRDAVGGCLLTSVLPEGQAAAALGSTRLDAGEVLPGDVFWAVVGTEAERADAARRAFAGGAAGVVVPQAAPVSPARGCWTLLTADVEQALCKLATWRRDRFNGMAIAIAGNDSLTTRGMIDAVLEVPANESARNRGAYGHQGRLGLALEMLNAPPEQEHIVFSVLPRDAIETHQLPRLCRPNVAVLVGRQEEAAYEAHAWLDALPHERWAVLNGDDPALRKAAAAYNARIVWVGRDADCDLSATDLHCGAGRLQFKLHGEDISVRVWGRHHLNAALAALAVGQIAGHSLRTAAEALARFEHPATTRQVVRRAETTWIRDESASDRAAFELLREAPTTGRRIALCRGLPDDKQALDRLADELITVGGADALVACGPHAEQFALAARRAGMPRQAALTCDEPRETARQLDDLLAPGSVVLARGWRTAVLERVWRDLERRGESETIDTPGTKSPRGMQRIIEAPPFA